MENLIYEYCYSLKIIRCCSGWRGVIYDICDEVAVMKDGKIEETGEKEAFFANPKTEYGKLLLDSVPTLPYLE